MGLTNTPSDLLPGTLELLILKALRPGAKHGYGIVEHLRVVSGDVLRIVSPIAGASANRIDFGIDGSSTSSEYVSAIVSSTARACVVRPPARTARHRPAGRR